MIGLINFCIVVDISVLLIGIFFNNYVLFELGGISWG